MQVFAHTDYVLRGYTRLTHEPVVFRRGHACEVTEAVAVHLTGSHPYEFCILKDGENENQHAQGCPLGGAAPYPTTEMEAPPMDTQMLPRRRGRPRLVRR